MLLSPSSLYPRDPRGVGSATIQRLIAAGLVKPASQLPSITDAQRMKQERKARELAVAKEYLAIENPPYGTMKNLATDRGVDVKSLCRVIRGLQTASQSVLTQTDAP